MKEIYAVDEKQGGLENTVPPRDRADQRRAVECKEQNRRDDRTGERNECDLEVMDKIPN